MIGGLMIPIFGLQLIGDGSISDGLSELWIQNPEKFKVKGEVDSFIPFGTIFTGMMIAQMYYWGTNQTITQRAMAAPNVKEAQKGIYAAAAIRVVLIPAMIVVPGLVSYNLFGDIGDAAYGRIVGEVLPSWLSGVFAAALAAAVLSTFNSQINSSAAMYVCDIHERYINPKPKVAKLSAIFSFILVAISLSLVPVFAKADSIIKINR